MRSRTLAAWEHRASGVLWCFFPLHSDPLPFSFFSVKDKENKGISAALKERSSFSSLRGVRIVREERVIFFAQRKS